MITLEEAKEHLRVEHDYEDALIQGLILAAYMSAERQTRRCLIEQDMTVTIDKLPRGAIELSYAPVQAVLSFDYIDPEGVPRSIDPDDLRLDTRPLYPLLMPRSGEWPAITKEPESVTFTIRTGYPETPADIRQAILMLIAHFYENREAVLFGKAQTLPMGADMLLRPYLIMRAA